MRMSVEQHNIIFSGLHVEEKKLWLEIIISAIATHPSIAMQSDDFVSFAWLKVRIIHKCETYYIVQPLI